MDVIEQTEKKFSFNVTRCRYAEMYKELGVQEYGALLSCGRDAALIAGFNPQIRFTRAQTIMTGAPLEKEGRSSNNLVLFHREFH